MSSSAITFPSYLDPTKAADGSAASPSFAFANSTSTGIYRVSANTLGISTAGVQRVVVDANGNVGVGVTPVSPLDVQKNSAATNPGSDNIFPSWTSGLTLRNSSSTDGAYSSLSFLTGNTAGTGQGFSIVSQSTASGFSSNLLFMARTASGTTTERMRIDANGRLGIGVAGTVPQQLSITGGIGFANQNATDKKLYSPTDGCCEWLTQNAAGAPFFAVSNNGTQNIRLYSTGTIYAQNTSIQPISSDAKLKQDIVNYDKGLTEILALQPRYFAYKTEPEKILAGFIAQEVDEAIPGALIETIDGNKSYQVDWNPILVKAIQELSAKVDAQAAEAAALRSEIAELKAK